ncbi:exo-beta-N-acetylmuramidase NamZ family protein [Alteribacter aurantiacus]|uniref:exo-beta-N-acetylmuramidase NamZ family protein n=1 Tax=Alteribacter aurantiacus TaxID=254410 RepID=UPI00040BBC75|nr:DUF1343 domain-containing protein [Alteribacter aurantiacus]
MLTYPGFLYHNNEKKEAITIKLGLDRFLDEEYQPFEGKRIGLVTNMTGVNKDFIPSIDLFHRHPHIQLTALYAPEHGIRGDAKEGESVRSTVDKKTGIPVYSLYGKSKKPSEQMLEDVDVVVFDLQDIGSRYYTYIYTMAYMMEACEAYDKHFVVLDRPNPISGAQIEGNVVEEDVRSFVGLLPIPNRHGLTIGELAWLFKDEFHYNCELTVVEMDGWMRDMFYDDTGLCWVPSSPNAPTVDMAVLYPGTCLFEGTNVSEGRGTTKPFEYVGAPFIDGAELAEAFNQLNIPGVVARPTSFVPTYQKHKDEVCGGVQLHVVDRMALKPLKAGVTLLRTVATLYPREFSFVQHTNGKYFFDLLAGTKTLREQILRQDTDAFFATCAKEEEQFKGLVKPFYLY